VTFHTGPVNAGRSTTLKVTDPNLSFAHAGRSSLVGQFDYSGP
jgi:hypothetical protein